jgi:hypothetical protein
LAPGMRVPDSYIDQFLYTCTAVIERAQHDKVTASLRAAAVRLFQQQSDSLRGQVLHGLLPPFFDRYCHHLLEMKQGFRGFRLCIPEKGMDRRQPEVACGHATATLRFQPVKEGSDAHLGDAGHRELLRLYHLPFLEIPEQELEGISLGPDGVGAHILLPGQEVGEELRQVEGEISRLHTAGLPRTG